jgi:hypothetical protein
MPQHRGVKRWLILLAACGGGSKHAAAPHRDPAAEAADAERTKLEAERPAKPYETRSRSAFRPSERCGQGPYRMDTYSLQAKYGEEIVVYACGPHRLAGNYRLTTERKGRKPEVDDSSFGWDHPENEACKSTKATAAMSSSGAGGGTTSAGGTASPSNVSAQPASSIATPMALEPVLSVAEECTQIRTPMVDMTYESYGNDVAIDGRLVIDIWSDEPNDFEGVYFVIEKRAVVADMTIERWKAYDQADRDWRIRYNAFVKGEVAAGRSEYVDTSVKTPPPPPPRVETQPPRPSTHARWIPGYWQYAEGSFHWLAGMWDVPEEDIAKDLTVHAPTPPPPPPVAVEQPQEAQPTTTAVWTPGQWQWDGRAYVWIAGAWRIPPTQQHEWKPATWSVSTRGAIFVPGGWRINVRLK